MNHDPIRHLCSDHCGEDPQVLALPVPDSLKRQWLEVATRRQFLTRAGKSLAWAGLAGLIGRDLISTANARPALTPHFAPKAKRAIYLFMAGAPSQLETWDPKPGLADLYNEDLPESVRGGQPDPLSHRPLAIQIPTSRQGRPLGK